jgi:acetate kinase
VSDAILTLNAGSSSVKFAVFQRAEPLALLLRGQVDGLPATPVFRAQDAAGKPIAEKTWEPGASPGHAAAVEFVLSWGRREGLAGRYRVVAAGHRVVHGGIKFTGPVAVDAHVLADLDALVPLAPLHQPHNVAAIRAVAAAAPALPQVACFDTAFHSTQPPMARAFAIPRRYADTGVRRYGFHGLSYEYIAHTLPAIDATAAAGRTIVAHLGNGASLCAMRASRSVATTMGFSVMDGLVMGTRCGSIDPAVILYLQQEEGLSVEQVQTLLYEESGLLGVSGIAPDMRTLLSSEDPGAHEAIELFVYRATREIGSMAAALGGLDSLVFTGGIGENAPSIREAIGRELTWLGLEIDAGANRRGAQGRAACISRAGSSITAWVVPANEELIIARHTAAALAGSLN